MVGCGAFSLSKRPPASPNFLEVSLLELDGTYASMDILRSWLGLEANFYLSLIPP